MKILIIQARNFGDAVISTQIINSIGFSFPDIKIDIFTKMCFRDIFINNPFIDNIYFSNFPCGTNKNFSIKETLNLIKQINILRKHKYAKVINNIGDFREILIGRLINPEINCTIKWEEGHIFNFLIRRGLYDLADEVICINKEIINIYEAQKHFINQLGCKISSAPQIFLDDKIIKTNIIGIHPFASQKSRMWEWEKWKNLVKKLSKHFDVWIFSSFNDKKKVEEIFEKELKNKTIKLKVSNLKDFFLNLSKLKLLIGLDSFSIHAAYAVGVQSIMLNGSNNYKIWQPENCSVISHDNLCDYYPCYNKPKCIGKKFEYICMRSIEEIDVLNVLEIALNRPYCHII